MSHFSDSVRRHLKNNILTRVFRPSEEGGRGRLCMLLAGMASSIVAQLSGGLFFTDFLLQHGLDAVSVGILNSIPSLAYLLNIFAPWFLEHFKKRKHLLVAGRLLYYVINIIGITLLPQFISNTRTQLIVAVILVTIANAINAVVASGFSAWQANFLPDHVRMDYFTSSGCINSLFTYFVVFGVSMLTDSFKGSPHQLEFITTIRYVAFALAIVDCIINLIPKEYPYINKAKPNLINIFKLPLQNKRFLLTILITTSYMFALNLPNAMLDAYVLRIGVSYSTVNGINATYFLFFILFSAMWKKFIDKFYWFRAFAYILLMQSTTYFAFAFVTSETIWLYVVIRFTQHVFGVVVNSIVSSLPYVNLPDADRTNYLAFNTILSNVIVFVSRILGTGFSGLMGERTLDLFGFSFSSTQILLFFCAVAQCLVAAFSYFVAPKVTPPDQLKRMAQENA